MHHIIQIKTDKQIALYDITPKVLEIISLSQIKNGIVSIYAQGATAAIMIQENWDESVQTDMVNLLAKIIPKGIWLHDFQDGNGDAHLKAGIIGPGEVIPLINGKLGLSRWQNIFFCEFDGPRDKRNIVVSIISGQ